MRRFMEISHQELKELLSEVFANSEIPETISDAEINDITEWDSMGNFNLLLAVEEKFDIRFDLEEMSEIRSVQLLVEALKNK